MAEASEATRQLGEDCGTAFRALESGGFPVEIRHFRLAGQLVRMRAAGRLLADAITASWAHLACDADPAEEAALRIELIDREETGVAPAGGVDTVSGDEPPSEWHMRALYSTDGRFVCQYVPASGSLWCLDRETSTITGSTGSAAGLSIMERGKPFQPLLSFWLNQGKRQLLHAGLVAPNGVGIVVPGSSGSGKSTTALCCLLGGFDYLGDDYLVLEQLAAGGFEGHSLYASAWLNHDHLHRFPALEPFVIRGRYAMDNKAMVLATQVRPGQIRLRTRIRHIVLPTVTGQGPTRLRPATRGEALRKMAPSCVMMSPRLGPEGFQTLTKLVQSAECHWLEIGEGVDGIAPALEALG